MVRRFNLRSADEGEHMTRAVLSSADGGRDSSFRCLQALIGLDLIGLDLMGLDEVVPVRQAKQVSSSKRRGCGAEERAKNKETRIGGWGGDPGLGGMRVGGPALLTLYGVNASQ